tara:strand:+ start:272 stop:577 length:306 start_codon:yes stop_codon:yes gene_type:complete
MLLTLNNTNDDDTNADQLAIEEVTSVEMLAESNLNADDITTAEFEALTEEERQGFFEWWYEMNQVTHPLDYIVEVVADDDDRFLEIHWDCESSDGISRHVG